MKAAKYRTLACEFWSVKERRDARRGSGKIKGKRSNAELREGTESEKERGHGDIVVDSRRSLDTLVFSTLQSSAAAMAREEPVSDGISACKLLVAVAHVALLLVERKLGRFERGGDGDYTVLAMRQAGNAVHLREILLLLPIAIQYTTGGGRNVLLSGLPRGVRRPSWRTRTSIDS